MLEHNIYLKVVILKVAGRKRAVTHFSLAWGVANTDWKKINVLHGSISASSTRWFLARHPRTLVVGCMRHGECRASGCTFSWAVDDWPVDPAEDHGDARWSREGWADKHR